MMITRRLATVQILWAMLGTSLLYAVDFSNYRGFVFGMNVSVAAKEAGMNPSEVRLVHQRPAVVQELEWRPRSPFQADPVKADPVQDGLLRFYNGELFQIVITYHRHKVEGMTPDDMIAAISLTYGAATRPTAEIAYHSHYGDVAPVIARWEDSQYSYNLVRTGDRTSFAMVLYSKRVYALAQAAIVEAVRLEELEAPQRAADLQKKQEAESRLMLEKTRSVNISNFRP
jgi:hypothetical protein